MLRLTSSRHSQPYSQSGSNDVASALWLRVSYNLAIFLLLIVLFIELFSGLQLGIDIPSTSNCPQLTHTGSKSEHALYIMAVADVLETRISTRARNHRII